MAASYPSATKSFTTKTSSTTIASAHINDIQDEVVAVENALRTSLQHGLLFTDATYDIGAAGATRPRDVHLSRNAIVGTAVYVADTSNAKVTTGVTINQGAADDEILALKSSDVAHGITDSTETDTYGSATKIVAASGGLLLSGFTEASSAIRLTGAQTTATATRSTAAEAPVSVNAQLKSGTGVTSVGADKNLLVVMDNGTTRFILDSDGDSHQDVGTAWTNFDDHNDIEVLELLSAYVTHEADPLKGTFGQWLAQSRAPLERMGLVTFNDEQDGRPFVNMSRLTMLLVGAMRQSSYRIAALEQAVARLLPPAQGVALG